MIALTPLVPYARPRRADTAQPRCELCGAPRPASHRHVIECGQRGIYCACHACAVLFTREDSATRFKTVPDRVVFDPSFALPATRWMELGVPVGLAFCYRDSTGPRAVLGYPGPAGIVDAELDGADWEAIGDALPLARELADDVEALIVYGRRGAQTLSCYLVPISVAYDLGARLRISWQGFTGGSEVERELATFFAELAARAKERR